MFLVPTKLIPTALTPLFSIATKARMALELLHPPRPSQNEDESVASWWDATLVPRPWTGSPTRCSPASMAETPRN